MVSVGVCTGTCVTHRYIGNDRDILAIVSVELLLLWPPMLCTGFFFISGYKVYDWLSKHETTTQKSRGSRMVNPSPHDYVEHGLELPKPCCSYQILIRRSV